MISNPIFRREFISTARSWKTNFLVFGYLLMLGFVLLLMWPGGGVLSAVSDKGRQIFQLFFSVNLTLLILIVPAFAATSITYERENETFSALFSTLLTPFEIMSGKLAAACLMLVILVFLAMPIASLCALTGGVNLPFLMKVLMLLMATAISYGLVGLACSSTCSSSSFSILLNYVLVLLLAGGTWLPDALLGNLVGFRFVWQMIRSISPYDALFYLLNPETYTLTTTVKSVFLPSPFIIYMFSSLGVSVVAFIIFFKGVMKPPEKTRKTVQMYSDTRKAIKRTLSWPFYLIDPLKRKKPIKRFSNPVFVAEMRSKLFANPKFVIRTVALIFIVSLVMLTLISFQMGESVNPESVRFAAIIFQIGVVAMLAPGVSSGLITDEITNQTFMPLRMTMLKPSTFVLGKMKATFFYALIFIVSSMFIIFAMAYLENQQIWPKATPIESAFWSDMGKLLMSAEWWGKFWKTYYRIIIWVVILLLCTATFLAAGLFASSVSKTSGIATAIAYSLTGIICVVTFAPVVLGGRLSESLASFIISFNPVAAAMQITSDSYQEYQNLWQHNLVALTCLTMVFIFSAMVRTWYLFRKQD